MQRSIMTFMKQSMMLFMLVVVALATSPVLAQQKQEASSKVRTVFFLALLPCCALSFVSSCHAFNLLVFSSLMAAIKLDSLHPGEIPASRFASRLLFLCTCALAS
jgi:hypothetical protein